MAHSRPDLDQGVLFLAAQRAALPQFVAGPPCPFEGGLTWAAWQTREPQLLAQFLPSQQQPAEQILTIAQGAYARPPGKPGAHSADVEREKIAESNPY